MTLFVVATPIGNLEDITLRAITVLKEADAIAAEDTRRTRKLLTRHSINTPLLAIHQHSQPAKLDWLVGRLQHGETIALVSDAGTPNIADPGGRLVEQAREAGIAVVPIPGASAVTAILSVAGIPTDSFMFVGFLPKKKGRQTLLKELKELAVPIVLFESPNRILKTLTELRQTLGSREVIVGRELTKLHEEILKLSLDDAIKHFTQHPPRGEFVIVVAPDYN